MKLRPKNWEAFQHYKDRRPPWIKLYRNLLDDKDFFRLPVASRALAPCLWLLASESENGEFDGDIDQLSFRLRLPEKEIKEGLKPLIDKGFFDVTSKLLADCLQDAIPETEERQSREQSRERAETVVLSVFAHWQSVHNHKDSRLSDARKKIISAALKDYSVDQLCESISGYKLSPFHQGHNDRGQVYDSIELMLKDAKRIDAGIGFARNPPRVKSAADLRVEAQSQAINDWALGQ